VGRRPGLALAPLVALTRYAALGVAVLSAIAATAGTLATAAGAVDACSRGFVGAAAVAGIVAAFALVRMPATRTHRRARVTCRCTEGPRKFPFS
jgi:hypothetical protein